MTSDLWRAAEATIGPGTDDDYIVTPTAHAERYHETAPDLAEVLQRTPVRIAAEEFERADGIAIEAQRAFKQQASWANVAALVMAWASAAVLVAALLDAPGPALIGLGVLGAVAGASGTFLTQRIRQQHLLKRWMAARADAERFRHAYFEQVTLAPAPEGADARTLGLLQLEYFRRHQLDVQVRYCDQRQRQHRRSLDRTVTYGAAAGFVAALSTGVAGLLGAGEGMDWAGLAALGIVGASLSSFASAREAIGQDERNAERLDQTRTALRDLEMRLDDVRAAVAQGNEAALREFVAAVHEHLALEHRQWLREAELAHSGLARLEAALRGDPPDDEAVARPD